MKRLQQIFNDLLNRLMLEDVHRDDGLVEVLYRICRGDAHSQVVTFTLDEQATNSAIAGVEQYLQEACPNYLILSESVSYLLDELTCNMQQHSQAREGILYAQYNAEEKVVELVLADHGISIYGSYVQAQKYLDLVGNSDAEALGLAKDGYSTKNLPDAENRGYGISSNIKLVTEGLGGEFAIYSGNALLIQTHDDVRLLELPEQLDVKGTVVAVRIPAVVPESYNFYDYIS